MSIPNPDARHVDYRARPLCDVTYESATQSGLDPFIASLLARRVRGFEGELAEWLAPTLRALPDPATLPDASVAAERLATAVIEGECIGLCTDYDVDGITAHTLVRDALIHRFGHPASLVRPYIGHRLNDGYGLSDNVCRRILDDQPCPAVIVTADCGTSDGPRIERLAAAGIDVIVTDHHGVPDAGIPAAALATVNPSRADSAFADPAIAGCAVAWFLMAQVRRVLVERGHLPANAPKLADSLDLVALGTVADAVSLFSPTNRVLVTSGLSVLNARRRPCWSALAGLLNRTVFDVEDLGFQIGPRINARGRVADPMAALRFLAALDVATAREALAVLDEDNRSRREIERRMVTTACRIAADQLSDDTQVVCVYHDEFHPGVQGIVASRLLDRFGRVTAVLSPAAASDTVSGSLRSVDGVDIGAALRALAGRYPDILRRHGGHPKAAGVTLAREQLEPFRAALAEEVRTQLGERRLRPVLWHDGVLGAPDRAVKTIDAMAALTPYGRGFEAPQFVGEFDVSRVRAVGADPVHLSLSLIDGAQKLRAIWFRALQNAGDPWPIAQGDRIECVYRLTRDTYRGGDAVQLTVENARTKDANS
ncbi:MAG: DHHA1 domain-containing protein [Pseudomonadota bacterium]